MDQRFWLHPEYAALLDRCRENFDDMAPRLILADWIEERNGQAGPVRELLLGDGDILFLGVPDKDCDNLDSYHSYTEFGVKLMEIMKERGKDVLVVTCPAAMTLRVARTRSRDEPG
mgnify:CR=1 FL=1